MSDKNGRRGFVLGSMACLAAPASLAAGPAGKEPPACEQETTAAVDQALEDCRRAGQDRAAVDKAVYGQALMARFGPGVVDVIRETTIAQTRERLKAAPLARRDLEAVKAELWDHMGAPFEWKLAERTATRLRFEVVRCPLAEVMRRQGAPELGFAYFCAYDVGFCEGLNPALRFTRTKTLMMGDGCCDHTYELPPARG